MRAEDHIAAALQPGFKPGPDLPPGMDFSQYVIIIWGCPPNRTAATVRKPAALF